MTYSKGQGPIFATHPMEKPYRKCIVLTSIDVSVIFQIGSSDPELALKAAQTVQQDVSGMWVLSIEQRLILAILIAVVPSHFRELA